MAVSLKPFIVLCYRKCCSEFLTLPRQVLKPVGMEDLEQVAWRNGLGQRPSHLEINVALYMLSWPYME